MSAQYEAVDTFHDDRDDTDIDAGTMVPEGHRLLDDHPDRFRATGAATAFDPGEHTVDDVNAHLADADDDEVARVLELERQRDGGGRKGILDAYEAG
jgi:hypothetical protein